MRVVVLHRRKKERREGRREEGGDEAGGREMGGGGVGREGKGRKELEASWPPRRKTWSRHGVNKSQTLESESPESYGLLLRLSGALPWQSSG